MLALLHQWYHQPRGLRIRRIFFQIHLWTGLGLGLYVLVISLTGSAVVFRNEIYLNMDVPTTLVAAVGERLEREALIARAEAQHPGYRVRSVFDARGPDQAVEIWLGNEDGELQRLFDPFTGEDLGRSVSLPIQVTSWLLDLHINLLSGETGRLLNGIGAAFLTLLSVTGLIVWWPGVASWMSGTVVSLGSNWRKFNWDLHSAVGFWTFLFVVMWAVTGVVVSIPEPYWAVVDYVEPYPDYDNLPEDYVFERRLGDQAFRWIARAHFGTFGGVPIKVAWVVLGLAPATLFVTGSVMWWNRVLRSRVRSSSLRFPR